VNALFGSVKAVEGLQIELFETIELVSPEDPYARLVFTLGVYEAALVRSERNVLWAVLFKKDGTRGYGRNLSAWKGPAYAGHVRFLMKGSEVDVEDLQTGAEIL